MREARIKKSEPAGVVERSGAYGVGRHFLGHENAVLFFVLVAVVVGMGIVTKGATLSKANTANVLLQS